MEINRLQKHMESLYSKMKPIMIKKGEDYSSTEDSLANFKRVGALIQILETWKLAGDLQYCLNLILLKIDRIVNLLKSSIDPKNETLEDSFIDLLNYIVLLSSLLEERRIYVEEEKRNKSRKETGITEK